VVEVPSQEVITKDNAMVKVDGIAFYQVMDAAQASLRGQQPPIGDPQPDHDQYPHGDGSMDLDELLSQRDEINHRLLRWSTTPPAIGASGRAHRIRTSSRRAISSTQWPGR